MTNDKMGRLVAVLGLAGAFMATLVLSVGLLVARLDAPAPIASALAPILPSADADARAAEAALAAGRFEEAERLTRRELAVSPARDAAWLRLARIDVAHHGRLGPQGIEALNRSYDAVPYERSASSPRRAFVQLHMVELSAQLRAQVEVENSTLQR